jgi:hypothetical protein
VVNPQCKVVVETGSQEQVRIMSIGRISGPMLKANLLREGVDLAFETDLLYLDVNNNRIGINKSNPGHDLDVSGTTRSTSLEITTLANIANVTISGSTINSETGVLELGTEDTVVYQKKLKIDGIEIENNQITSLTDNIEIRPATSFSVEINSDVNVYGNMFVTGNITTEGNIILGDDSTEDTVIFNAKINSNIVPSIDNTYDLGSDEKIWKSAYVKSLYSVNADVSSRVTADNLKVGDIEILLNQIRTFTENTDLILTASGTGKVKIENFSFKNNTIVNTVADSITIFSNTNNGYVKIEGTRGVVIPTGNSAQRPSAPFREAGMIRFNVDDQRIELFNGNEWSPTTGVTLLDAKNIAIETVLMLG